MVNWYYVQGSERVGPVGEDALRDLYKKHVLNEESYVWKKGFQNWEHLKNVKELDFAKQGPGKSLALEEVQAEVKIEESSPEVTFIFDWHKVKDSEEIFFIKVGRDRKTNLESKCFGPYSLIELRESLEEKRINNRTLIFTPGLSGWIEVGETPLDPKNFNVNISHVQDSAPLIMVMDHGAQPIVALVDHAGNKECTLLASGPFKMGNQLLCSIYMGSTLKAKNIKINVEEYDPKRQKAICKILDMNDNARKIMQNYAN
ncbi:MAG: DUF4339 domain-containing protein [Bacteriovorax sp.]